MQRFFLIRNKNFFQTGLTILEVLITFTIVSILLGFSYFFSYYWLEEYYLDASINYAKRIFEYIQTMQNVALENVMLCHSEQGKQCDAGKSAQYLIFKVKTLNSKQLQQLPQKLNLSSSVLEEKLRFFPSIHSSVTVAWQFFMSSTPNVKSYFYGNSRYQNNGSLVFCQHHLPKKALIINSFGKMRVSSLQAWPKESLLLRKHLYNLAKYC